MICGLALCSHVAECVLQRMYHTQLITRDNPKIPLCTDPTISSILRIERPHGESILIKLKILWITLCQYFYSDSYCSNRSSSIRPTVIFRNICFEYMF